MGGVWAEEGVISGSEIKIKTLTDLFTRLVVVSECPGVCDRADNECPTTHPPPRGDLIVKYNFTALEKKWRHMLKGSPKEGVGE